MPLARIYIDKKIDGGFRSRDNDVIPRAHRRRREMLGFCFIAARDGDIFSALRIAREDESG